MTRPTCTPFQLSQFPVQLLIGCKRAHHKVPKILGQKLGWGYRGMSMLLQCDIHVFDLYHHPSATPAEGVFNHLHKPSNISRKCESKPKNRKLMSVRILWHFWSYRSRNRKCLNPSNLYMKR